MSKFEQLLDNILDCVTESVEDMVIETEPTVIDLITESVINGDISVDECILLLESVDNSEYHISVLDRFEEGVIDNDECIVLLEATRYEKEHTKALQELQKQNTKTKNKIKTLKNLQSSLAISNSTKEKITNQIENLNKNLNDKISKYKKNYSEADYPFDNEPLSSINVTRLTLGKNSGEISKKSNTGEYKKHLERKKDFNIPSKNIREPGRYLKAQQEK